MFPYRRRRGLSPIWVFALVYLGYSLLVPLLQFSAVLVGLGIAAGAAAGVAAFVKERLKDLTGRETVQGAVAEAVAHAVPHTEKTAPAPVEKPAPASAEDLSRYSPAVQAVIRDGKLAMSEMNRLYGSIRNDDVRRKINELMVVSDKIIQDAREDESDVPQIRKFLDFYMPTTLKLLNAYDRMDAVEVEGETIGHSKQSIEEMLDTTIAAYKKQLDALFGNQAMDIDAEIRAMKGMLDREGLGEKNPLDWNSFKEQFDKEKGTVQNG